MSGSRNLRWISLAQQFLYICFVLLWFKDNFSPLRNIHISYFFALVPLVLISLYRVLLKVRHRKIRIRLKFSRETAALLALLLLAIAVRIPQLAYPNGTMNSDDAIMALMGKHISEGKTPPICFYGQAYLGSLSSHFCALFFRLFGYSVLVLKCATLLIFLGFMAVSFFFLKEIFSFPFAAMVTFFFALPFPVLVRTSLDNTSAFALIFFLGTLMIYLSYLIAFKGKEKWLPLFGFLVGVAFWTHPLTASFILTALLILLIKTKFEVKRYAQVAWFAILGFLPQLFLEISEGFGIFRFLSSGTGTFGWTRLRTSLGFLMSMLSSSEHPSRYFFLFLIFAGVIYLVFLSFHKKSFMPQTALSLVFLFCVMFYVFSHFGGRPLIRYLYPSYLCLPVLLIAPFLVFRSQRARNILSASVILVLFVFYNLGGSRHRLELVKERHFSLAQLAEAMEKTGKRYWYGEYWTAYLLTAVSKEKLIVDSYSVNRYPAYSLACSNNEDELNYVFFRSQDRDQRKRYATLRLWLKTLGIPAKTEDIGKMHLVYGIKGRLYPPLLRMAPPRNIPEIRFKEARSDRGFLRLLFENPLPGQSRALWLTAEIPDFCSRRKRLSPADPEVGLDLPLPKSHSFVVRQSIDRSGVEIPSSIREISFSFPGTEIQDRKNKIVFLRGFGPVVRFQEEQRTVMEKVASFELNGATPGDIQVRLILYSPFDFSSWRWYGKFVQKARIELNNTPFMELELEDGRNLVELQIPNSRRSGTGDIITVHFDYHIWSPSTPAWKTAAFLDKIVVN
jgi:hypothetical protein